MPDDLSEVSRGQPFKPSASAWNSFVRAAKSHRMQERGKTGGDGFEDSIDPALTCLVKWTGSSIDTLAAHSVLAYGDAIINVPSDNKFLAQQRPIFEASAPAAATDQFVITTEPIVGQQIGRAVCAGLAVVKVNVSDAGHTRAVPVASETDYLASAASGGVPILYKESGTGELWAVVRIDEGGGESTICFQVVTDVVCDENGLTVTTAFVHITGAGLSVTVDQSACPSGSGG